MAIQAHDFATPHRPLNLSSVAAIIAMDIALWGAIIGAVLLVT